MESFEQILQKGEEAEATTISGEVPAEDADKTSFRFSEEEKEEMRSKGMSEEDIREKEETARKGIQKDVAA